MEQIFLRVLNMSIAATYVIIVVIIGRAILSKAPRKYAYYLWSVVWFRLICPFSLTSHLSFFRFKFFNMSVAQKSSDHVLTFIPENIGYMAEPKVTVGIETMNALITERLPVVDEITRVNPLQLYITLGTWVWVVGMVILFGYSLWVYLRMRKVLSTAILYEKGVYLTDQYKAPFIFGVFLPRIMMPFGLKEEEISLILDHERFHIKRHDHQIQFVSYCLKVFYWFNPLITYAFHLMTRDLEMSCDESVIKKGDSNILKQYSQSLVSFGSNQSPYWVKPLAFGEHSITKRVRHILAYTKPKKIVLIFSLLVAVTVIVACGVNPEVEKVNGGLATNQPVMKAEIIGENNQKLDDILGSYVFVEQIYMNPLSSYIAFDLEEYYTFTENLLIISGAIPMEHMYSNTIQYESVEFDGKVFEDFFIMEGFGIVDIDPQTVKDLYYLKNESGLVTYHLYVFEDKLWLAKVHYDRVNTQKSTYFWSIYEIIKSEGMPEYKYKTQTKTEGVEEFLALLDPSANEVGQCYNITPPNIEDFTTYRIFKFEESLNSYLLYEGAIYPVGIGFGGFGVTSMAAYDMDQDGYQELFYTYSFGSGLHRSHLDYFDPVEKAIVAYDTDFIYINKDLLLVPSSNGGLAVYEAEVEIVDSLVDISLKPVKWVMDIVGN